MKTRFSNTLTLLVIAVSAGYLGYRVVVKSGWADPADVSQAGLNDARATTISLPSGTNNAWQMDPFNLPDLQGKPHQLGDWKGKVIMLNFWASWCGPCQYEIPEFVRYQELYKDRGLQIVGVGVDVLPKLKNTARSLEINYPVLVLAPQKSRQILSRWGNPKGVIPHTVVIGRNGVIEYIHRGKMGDEEFEAYVLPLLSGK